MTGKRAVELVKLTAPSDYAEGFKIKTSGPALFRRKYFLNADLIDETGSADVRQMSLFLLVRQVRANAVSHYHTERTIIHIQPVRPPDELIGAVPDERAINNLA
jgi:hypothetical protein